MKIPKTINILGIKYKVKFTDDILNEKIMEEKDKGKDVVGYCSVNDTTILISTKTNKQNYISIFFHEVLEAIDGHLELGLSHPNISRLETALYQVLATNKLLKK